MIVVRLEKRVGADVTGKVKKERTKETKKEMPRYSGASRQEIIGRSVPLLMMRMSCLEWNGTEWARGLGKLKSVEKTRDRNPVSSFHLRQKMDYHFPLRNVSLPSVFIRPVHSFIWFHLLIARTLRQRFPVI